MKLPKHTNPSQNRTASAPYNFVPLPEKVVQAVESAEKLPDHDCYDTQRHTGYFDVTLTTRSPLYVRCPFTLEDFLRQERGEDENLPLRQKVKNTPDFFYTRSPDEPVIPGSSLRGMLRSLLEIVSYGKLERITGKKLFFRTVDDTAVGLYYRGRMVDKVETGFLRRTQEGYTVRVCQVVRVRREQLPGNLYEGQAPNKTPIWQSKQQSQTHQWKPVWVRLSENERFVEDLRTSPQQGFKEGRLVITGDVPRKKKEFVFLLPEATDEKLDVPDTLIELFHNDDQLTQWQESAFPTNQPRQGYRQRAGMIGSNPLAPGEPVFFLRERSQLAFMGRAQMFRLPYHRTPHDLVPLYLHDTKQIDYADALFGYIKHGIENNQSGIRQGNKYLAYASRVSVTNASLMGEPENIWLSDRAFAPKILASPKPSAFQHYLTQQEPDTKRELDHYGSPPPHETTLRGHKLYWHQGSRQRSDLEDQNVPNNSTQHTQFRPVREGAQFKFRIHFENLSNRELGALCWVLHPVGPEEQDYCHSLGMGKPLGMGAVKLEASLHLTNRSKRYSALFAADDWEMGLSSQIENLGTRATLLKRTKPFENHILSELAPEPTCKHLYELKRIAILLKMLEWPGFPSQPNGLLHLGSRPNTRYMAIQPNEYRDRPVLPDPSAFGVLTGESKPIVAVFMDKKAKGNWTQDEAACERDLETWIVSLYTEGDTKEAERKSTQIIQLAQKHVTKLNIKKLIEKVQSRL